MKARTFAALALALLPLLLGQAAEAQVAPPGRVTAELGVEPEEVTVGQPFHSGIRLRVPPGFRVEYDAPASGDSLELVAAARSRAPEGTDSLTIFTLIAWAAGPIPAVEVRARIIGPDGTESVRSVGLRMPEVRSVLPAPGEEEVQPRPARGVFVPSPFASYPGWWWLMLLIGALLAALVGYLLLRRDRAEPAPLPADPREVALARLAEASRWIASGPAGSHRFYEEMSGALRRYLDHLDPSLGVDRTTTELTHAFAALEADPRIHEGLSGLLDRADAVKFARRTVSAEGASADAVTAEAWVREYPPPAVEERRTAA
jgi:hypothetical protein